MARIGTNRQPAVFYISSRAAVKRFVMGVADALDR